MVKWFVSDDGRDHPSPAKAGCDRLALAAGITSRDLRLRKQQNGFVDDRPRASPFREGWLRWKLHHVDIWPRAAHHATSHSRLHTRETPWTFWRPRSRSSCEHRLRRYCSFAATLWSRCLTATPPFFRTFIDSLGSKTWLALFKTCKTHKCNAMHPKQTLNAYKWSIYELEWC